MRKAAFLLLILAVVSIHAVEDPYGGGGGSKMMKKPSPHMPKPKHTAKPKHMPHSPKAPHHSSTGVHAPKIVRDAPNNEGVLTPVASVQCPDNMVFVPGVVSAQKQTYDACVDAYEAYLVQVATDGTEAVWPFNQVPTPGLAFQARIAPGVKPQAYMSGDASAAACARAGKRLCRLEEWLGACQGPHKYTFPYGPTLKNGNCNIGRKSNPVMDVFGSAAKFDGVQMNDPRLDMLPNTVADTGAFTACVSDYGAYDMHGNLDEWVDHINQPSGHGSFSGGFFVDASLNGPGCLYRTTAHVTSWHDYSLGFRCCQDAL